MSLPVELKSIEPFLARSNELKLVEPAISYWCRFDSIAFSII